MSGDVLIEHTMRKLGAYEGSWCNFRFFVLGKYCWVKQPRKKEWIVKTVKKSEILHEFLHDLIGDAYDFDHIAGIEAETFARFIKSGRYTRHYAKQAS